MFEPEHAHIPHSTGKKPEQRCHFCFRHYFMCDLTLLRLYVVLFRFKADIIGQVKSSQVKSNLFV